MQYKISCEPFPVLQCEMTDGESVICQNGAMAWQTPNMELQTTTNGGIGKVFGRIFSGESMFVNRYIAHGNGSIAFSSHFPGSILPVRITPGHDFVVQKQGFLASENSVEMSIFWQKKVGAALFGGEGFIMQRLSGDGMAFCEIDGYMQQFELAAGERIVINTGFLAAMDASCTMDAVSVKGLKNVLFGGEGFFNTVVTGPGRVYLQTKPISSLANALKPYLPSTTTTVSSGSSD